MQVTSGREPNGQFKKGVSGNPSGRAKKAREERYQQILKEAVTFTQWRKIIKKLATKAERGDIQATRLLLEYVVGKPTQRTELSGEIKTGDGITDDERFARVAAILDGARARRDRPADDGDSS